MQSLTHHAIRPCRVGTLLMVLSGAGCQAWHTQQLAPEAVLAARHAAQLRITRADGSHVVIQHPKLQGDTVVGIGRGQQGKVRVPVADIRAIATRGFSPERTVALGVGVAALAYGAFLIGVAACGCY